MPRTPERPEQSLLDRVRAELAAGCGRPDAVAALEQRALNARHAGDEAAEEIIFEILDRLTGWCAPGAVL